jgi:hypothetical protein
LDFRLARSQAITGRHNLNFSSTLSRLDNQKRQSIKRGAVVGVKWLNCCGIPVVHGLDRARARNVEVDEIVRRWAQIAIFIFYADGDE